MQFEEFRKLSLDEQHKIVSNKGVMLRERLTHSFLIFLYGLDGFYIELFFHKKSGIFATLKPFNNLDELSPYLEDIDLGKLFN
jgi:hypothetical protein